MPLILDDDEYLKYLIVADISFLSLNEKLLLKNKLDSFNDIALMSLKDVCLVISRVVTVRSWDTAAMIKKAKTALALIKAFDISCVCYDREGYPPLLKEIPDSPFMLFYRGNLSLVEKKCISIVGTRRADVEAAKAASSFAKDACDNDWVIVSGLAFGIDINAHMGALQGNLGGTIAVLPGGIDNIVPSSHKRYAASILAKGGCVLSEYVPGTPAQPFRYVHRNRIIAALSEATVVIQAPAGSGSLITADFAVSYNRDVIIHSVAFSPRAKVLEEFAQKELKSKLNRGQSVKFKLENTVERYKNDGAPVISCFDDYIKYSNGDLPYPFCNRDDKQISLF